MGTDVEEVWNEIGEDFAEDDEDDEKVDDDEDDEKVDDDEHGEEVDDDEFENEWNDDENENGDEDDEFEDESEDTWKVVDEYKDEENQEELEQWDLDFDKNAIETGAVENIEKSIPLNDNTVADWWDEDDGGGLISIPVLFAFAVAVVGIVYFLKKRASPDTTIRIGYAPVPGAAKSHTR